MYIADHSLDEMMHQLQTVHHATLHFGVELEWILCDSNGQPANDAICAQYLQEIMCSMRLHSTDKEEGAGQVEAALHHGDDYRIIIENVVQLRKIAHDIASKYDLYACFDAKPIISDYGNGMHVHCHLQHANDRSLLYSKQGNDISDALSASIGGLLYTLPDTLSAFMGDDPTASARFTPNMRAPVTVSWGTNNRTTALRLPDDQCNAQGMEAILRQGATHSKRIEHRVACASANITHVLTAITYGILDGLTYKRQAPLAIYGDASDAQYALPLLTDSIKR